MKKKLLTMTERFYTTKNLIILWIMFYKEVIKWLVNYCFVREGGVYGHRGSGPCMSFV